MACCCTPGHFIGNAKDIIVIWGILRAGHIEIENCQANQVMQPQAAFNASEIYREREREWVGEGNIYYEYDWRHVQYAF